MSLDRVPCAHCGVEHDLSDLEPSFWRPDHWFAVPEEERATRIWDGNDACAIRAPDDTDWRYFLRALLPVPVHGEERAFCHGLWVEVPAASFHRVIERWRDPELAGEPAFPGGIANAILGYPPTVGLPGTVQPSGPDTVPYFRLAEELDHPLAREQRAGVWPERVLEWVSGHLHDR